MKFLQTTIFALSLSTVMFCQSDLASDSDYHLKSDSEHELYAASAFAHGHRHGYEEGFHVADVDVHMGRTVRDMTKSCKESKPQGYRAGFGNKAMYDRGYALGFAAGYEDSYHEREFRPTAEVLKAQLANIGDQNLRTGFQQGVDAARSEGASLENSRVVTQCRSKGGNAQFCDGYALGLLMQRDTGEKLSADNSSHGGQR